MTINSFNSRYGLTIAAGLAGSETTIGQPSADTVIRGSSVSILGKRVSWVSNGSGKYTLIGE